MGYGPKKIDFQEVIINSLGSLIAGIIGSIFILVITFVLGNSMSIVSTFESNSLGISRSPIFPLILSVITLIATTVSIYFTYKLLTITSGEKYKTNIVVTGQILFFAFITYLFITPMYIYLGLEDYDNIMYIFLAHVIVVTFGTHIILEALNNYRHILIGIYGSFIGLFVSLIITISIFTSFNSGLAKLISLVILLPIINFTIIFFKQLFEIAYYKYYIYTNQDQLGDIFYQIETEEMELLKIEEEKNNI